VAINGQGFTKSTNLQVAGVVWSNLQFISSSLLNITLSGPGNLAGKLFVLTDAGNSTRYFSNLIPSSLQDEVGSAGIHPIFPATTYVYAGASTFDWWLENDSTSPIQVTFNALLQVCTPCQGNPRPASKTITVPAGGWYFAQYDYQGSWPAEGGLLTASAPIHVLQAAIPSTGPLPELNPTALSAGNGPFVNYECLDVIDYRLGDANPSITCNSYPYQNVIAGTDDGNPWMQASLAPRSYQTLQVSFNPADLGVGSHVGVVKGSSAYGEADTPFQLNIHPKATISTNTFSLVFYPPANGASTIQITSTSPAVPITVTSSASWLTVTPTSGTTPATITASVDPSTPANQNATITIQGPGNAVVIPVNTFDPFVANSGNPVFVAKAGDTKPQVVSTLTSESPMVGAVSTNSGGQWLSVTVLPPGSTSSGYYALNIVANPSGLAAGVYQGTVTVTQPTAGFSPTVPVSVTLPIWGNSAPPLTVSPPSLTLTPGLPQVR
jgi:hypothetical protein